MTLATLVDRSDISDNCESIDSNGSSDRSNSSSSSESSDRSDSRKSSKGCNVTTFVAKILMSSYQAKIFLCGEKNQLLKKLNFLKNFVFERN